MATSTPGPWHVKKNMGNTFNLYDDRGRGIATTLVNTRPEVLDMHFTGEAEANARLLAAAPLLYAALVEARERMIGGGPAMKALRAQADAAIAAVRAQS